MTKQLNFDDIILGSGIAGYSAAITLAKAGQSVGIIELLFNERPIRSLFMIKPTPINTTEIDGASFDHRCGEICTSLGVHRTTFDVVADIVVNQDRIALGLEVVFEEKQIWSAKSMIFAPNFNHPKEQPEYIKNANDCFGKGLSFCGWSDMPFCKEKNVCVIGDGYWAYDQIRWALYYTNDVTFLCTTPTYRGGCISEQKLRELIPVFTDVNVYSIHINEKKDFPIVHFLAEGVEQQVLFYCVFWAPEQVCDWSILGGRERAEQLKKQGFVHFAGIAAGMKLWDHDAQYQHGTQVAERSLEMCTSGEA